MDRFLFLLLFLSFSCKGENNESPETFAGDSNIEDTGDCSDCLWNDEFNDPSINSDNWNFEIGYGDNGWGNDEWQEYTDQNAAIVDGSLVITTRKESDNLGKRDGSITSSRITTQEKFEFGPGSPNNETGFPQKLYVDYIRVYSL